MNDRLQTLTFIHSTLVETGKLDRDQRPHSLQHRLDIIQKQIMEELERSDPNGAKATSTTKINNDDIPY